MTDNAPAPPGYDVEFDAEARILAVTLRGFWTLATMAGFTAKLMATATAARMRHGVFDVMADMSGYPVQSQVVSGAMSTFLKTTATVQFGRLAIVSSGALNRMQSQRQTPTANARYFETRDAALRWLKEGGD